MFSSLGLFFFPYVTENKLWHKRKEKWLKILTAAEVRKVLKFYHVTSGSHVGIFKLKKIELLPSTTGLACQRISMNM